ncbi:MAG: hypothetical protein JRN68_01045 [Nitrososphaerota archaeon]|nr:hypothetical protein [Ferrimicrobium acidiphilum]MDG6933262.1 hypothetical protein [Nitrososphaerota archaeon]
MTYSDFETIPLMPRVKPSRAHLTSMRPKARQVVERFISNLSGHVFGSKVAQSVSFFMQEANYSNPEVFSLMAQEARKLPKTPAQQLMIRIINGIQSSNKTHGRRKKWRQ